MAGAVPAHVCLRQLASEAGGLFHCFAEFIVQPVARTCLFPREMCKTCFVCDIGRTATLYLAAGFYGRRSYSFPVPPAELASRPSAVRGAFPPISCPNYKYVLCFVHLPVCLAFTCD